MYAQAVETALLGVLTATADRAGCNKSLLVVGPRGSGKTLVRSRFPAGSVPAVLPSIGRNEWTQRIQNVFIPVCTIHCFNWQQLFVCTAFAPQ